MNKREYQMDTEFMVKRLYDKIREKPYWILTFDGSEKSVLDFDFVISINTKDLVAIECRSDKFAFRFSWPKGSESLHVHAKGGTPQVFPPEGGDPGWGMKVAVYSTVNGEGTLTQLRGFLPDFKAMLWDLDKLIRRELVPNSIKFIRSLDDES